MRYPRYAGYKHSGVEWLGEVPEHWTLQRLGQHFGERRERASDSEYEPLSVTKDGIVPRLETAAKTQDGDNRKLVRKGDFVINSRSDRKGSAGISGADGSVSLISIVLEPSNIDRGFAHHLLRSVPFQEEFYRWGKGIVADLWSTNFADMKNILLCLPPTEEQQAISLFLSDELARIDALIAEQQRLIELLKEKRQAVISQAVTKGLDSSASMKNSGVEWLGDVPAHWRVVPLRRIISSIQTGSTPPAEILVEGSDDGLLWYTPGDFSDSGIQLGASSRRISTSRPDIGGGRVFSADTVLVVGIGATLGKVGYLTESASANQQVNALLPSSYVNGRFLAYSLLSSTEALRYLANTSTIGIINQERMKEMVIAVPPLSEQAEIVAGLEGELMQLSKLDGEANQMVQLLIERRAALIAAAVTGRIDVRNWQQPSTETVVTASGLVTNG